METEKKEMCEKPTGKRRKNIRINCSRFVCSCTVLPERTPGGQETEKKRGALLKNICSDGGCLETNFAPPSGSSMDLHIQPIEGPDVKVKIRVKQTRQSAKKGFYIVHSEFYEISGRNRQNLLLLLDTISRLQENLSLV